MKTSTILSKAATILTKKKWVRFMAFADATESPVPAHKNAHGCCVLGAIDLAARSGTGLGDATLFLNEHLGGEGVARWNDHVAKSKREVIAVLKAAALRAEKEGR